MEDYRIRKMAPAELQTAIDWAASEGWNPGLQDSELFYNADNHGFFAGEIDGKIVAVGSAVCYSDDYAFCGLYIVAPKYRGHGLGLALTKARLEYCAERNVGIDGVLENVEIYQRVGYRPFHLNHRFQALARQQSFNQDSIDVINKHSDLTDILRYDRRCFPAERKLFLQRWIQQANAKTVTFRQDGHLLGFAVRRKCLEGYKIGPLFADTAAVAKELFCALQDDIIGEPITLDVPANNPAAMLLAQDASMEKVFATMRMYQKKLPEIEHNKVYGITTFELG